ncbi:MAG: hypothetical protein M1423_06505, partial [Acidobacteria bacterium]|nr:hypothetical protein [Acidobacteriota bacterium]
MNHFTRFYVLALVLVSGILVATSLLVKSFAQTSSTGTKGPGLTEQAGPASAPIAHPSAWSAALSRDHRTITLAYDGAVWVTGLEVRVLAGDSRLDSGASPTGLVPEPSPRVGEWVFKVPGPQPYEIVLTSDGPALAVSVAGFPSGGEVQAAIVAAVYGGRDPIQVRLRDSGDGVLQMESGGAVSTLNDCVYDRFRDQALQVLGRRTSFRRW